MTIGQAADRLAVNVQTIRLYEREGLLPRLPRNAAGYRQFDADIIKRIQFMQHAQDVGFTLREISELLLLRADPDGSCDDVQCYARREDYGAVLTAIPRARRYSRLVFCLMLNPRVAVERRPTFKRTMAVIGGGMAGLPIANKAAYKGQKAVLLEQEPLGGTYLNRIRRCLKGDQLSIIGCPGSDEQQPLDLVGKAFRECCGQRTTA